jgi:protein-S-isoprenylcysteine O-methyltransferase Ste14
MDTELTFRRLLLTLFLAFIAHRGYYTRKLGRSEQDTVKQRPSSLLEKIANALSLPGLLAVLVYVFYPAWMEWAALPLPVWLRWAGVILALTGFGILQWAHIALAQHWSDQPRLLTGHMLVTNGPYRWIRHPMYTAFLCILGSTLLVSANWFIGLMWLGMTTLDIASRINFEEALMLDTFGDEYRAYMTRTGRLLPRLAR